MIRILKFMSIKCWIGEYKRGPELGSIKSTEDSAESSKKELWTKWLLPSGRSNYRVWIILPNPSRVIGFQLKSHATLYIHVLPTFLSSRDDRFSLGIVYFLCFLRNPSARSISRFRGEGGGGRRKWMEKSSATLKSRGRISFVSPLSLPFRQQ